MIQRFYNAAAGRRVQSAAVIGAQVYAVNEDGDRPDKREFCRTHGLE